jgi:hypothetical protein
MLARSKGMKPCGDKREKKKKNSKIKTPVHRDKDPLKQAIKYVYIECRLKQAKKGKEISRNRKKEMR